MRVFTIILLSTYAVLWSVNVAKAQDDLSKELEGAVYELKKVDQSPVDDSTTMPRAEEVLSPSTVVSFSVSTVTTTEGNLVEVGTVSLSTGEEYIYVSSGMNAVFSTAMITGKTVILTTDTLLDTEVTYVKQVTFGE